MSILLFFISFFVVSNAQGQQNYTSVGVIANIPLYCYGFRIYQVKYDMPGWFFDYKSGFFEEYTKDNFYENISINTAEDFYNDKLLQKKDGWTVINFGFIFDDTNLFTLKDAFNAIGIRPFLGAGIVWKQGYREYKDEHNTLSNDGHYWIEDKSKKSFGVNFTTGLIKNVNNSLDFQLGIDSNPKSLYAGISYILPFLKK